MIKQAIPIAAGVFAAGYAKDNFADTLAKIPVLPLSVSSLLVGVAVGMLAHKFVG